ncbi:hypothetical protein BG015_006768, partial [Linnemannia schmuckeri]
LQTYKVNFRRIPQHYKPSDVIQLFSKYGNPMEIGMYYHAHPKRKVYTQDGYVLFEKAEKPSHPELPKEIVAGPGHPIITNIVGALKPKPTPTSSKPNTIKESNNAPPAKDAKEHDAASFKQQRKRNGKKRRKNAQMSSPMEGIESTQPVAVVAPVATATPIDPTTPVDPTTPIASTTPITPTPQESTQEARPSDI